MSLKAFHFFFIIISVLLAAYLGGWCYQDYADNQQSQMLLGAIGSFAAALGLLAYLGWFLKKSKTISFLGISVALFLSSNAFACPVCIGDPNHPMVRATASGVWLLLTVVTGVLFCFASLFILWGYRSKKLVS